MLYLYHLKMLPYPGTDLPVKDKLSSIPFIEVFREYFSQKKIFYILGFILLYRFGEGLLIKMAQPFMLDSYEREVLA